MIDKKYLLELPDNVINYLNKLEKEKHYKYFPSINGLTRNGEFLELGFSTYALKIYFMTSRWEDLSPEKKDEWINYINSFQVNIKNLPANSFVDKNLLQGYNNLPKKEDLKYLVKSILNTLPNKSFDTKRIAVEKAVNAETKQAISTLYEVGSKNIRTLENSFKDEGSLSLYLGSLDWSKPWSAGAQFSSICVYTKTQNFLLDVSLNEFIVKKLNMETGSYHEKNVTDSREIINGAMKVITGLDWLNAEIHHPKKLIDFCLANVPKLEGCDIVDFIYVLYKCSKQVNYKKNEINDLFKDLLDQIMKLYVKDEGGFSYFYNKSQTHYYGVQITEGIKQADIHGTTLCLWALLMILDSLEIQEKNMNIIKP